MVTQKGTTKSRQRKGNFPSGIAYIQASFNNTIISITSPTGDVLFFNSSGQCGFKGSRKSTPYAAQVVATTVAKKALDFGMKNIDVFVKGPGPGREPAIRALSNSGLKVKTLIDNTPIPHNGCRRPKKRRV